MASFHCWLGDGRRKGRLACKTASVCMLAVMILLKLCTSWEFWLSPWPLASSLTAMKFRRFNIPYWPCCCGSWPLGWVLLLLCIHSHRAAQALSDAFVWRLSLWRLTSVAYMPNSRTERPRKTKVGIEVAHVTRTPLSRSKGQRSTCCWCLK